METSRRRTHPSGQSKTLDLKPQKIPNASSNPIDPQRKVTKKKGGERKGSTAAPLDGGAPTLGWTHRRQGGRGGAMARVWRQREGRDAAAASPRPTRAPV